MKKSKRIIFALLVSAIAVLLCSCGNANVEISKDNFPDETFRKYVLENFDVNGDGFLNKDETSKVIVINVSNMGISKLDGIQYFTALKKLDCSNNKLTELDVSECKSLEELDCSNNQITELKMSDSLEKVDTRGNQLDWFDKIKLPPGYHPIDSFCESRSAYIL